MQQFLKIIGNGQRTARDLTPAEAEAAFTLIMDGQASLPQVAAFMAALRIKEESTDELAVFARVRRRYCQTTQIDSPYLVDICVPYDGRSRRPSIIPLAALIAASAGAKVSLHGRNGQSTPPKFGVGIGDILAALKVPVTNSLDANAALLDNEAIGIAYVDTTHFAPALERFNSVRFDYGMRSFFNTIEKLINPFTAPNGIIGVFHGPVLERVAGAMQAQGYRSGIAVQGLEGAIDILTSRRTPIIEFGINGQTAMQSGAIDPADFGWWDRGDDTEKVMASEITTASNAALIQQLLTPTTSEFNAFQRAAMMTAALIVYASGRSPTFTDALTAVQMVYISGDVAERLARWQSQLVKNVETDHVH